MFFSSISRILFIRRRSNWTVGSSSFRGAAQWYQPVEIGFTLTWYLLQTFVTAATSSVVSGITTAQGRGM